MDIRGLGYIGINARDLQRWRQYADTLGTMAVGGSAGLCLRIDERPFRVVVSQTEEAERLAFTGWEVADAQAFDCAVDQLRAAGSTVGPHRAMMQGPVMYGVSFAPLIRAVRAGAVLWPDPRSRAVRVAGRGQSLRDRWARDGPHRARHTTDR